MSAKVASPVQRFTISAAMASALNTRSGASSTQPPCASLCTSRTPRGSRGRASSAMADGTLLIERSSLVPRHEGARRNMPGRDISMIKRVEHRPQYIALEFERSEHAVLRLGRTRILLDIVQRKSGVALGLRRTL